MDLSPRQVAFVKSEMKQLEEDTTRQPTARIEAGRVREKAEQKLTE